MMMSPDLIPNVPFNIEAAFARMEGKIDGIAKDNSRQGEDIKLIRQRIHEHANLLQSLSSLDIPKKLEELKTLISTLDTRIEKLESDYDQRKGAANLARALYALISLLGLGGIVAIVKMIGG